MIKSIKSFIVFMTLACVVSFSFTSGVTYAACGGGFLTLPPWYRGLTDDATCQMKPISNAGDGLRNYVITIILNVIEMVMHLVVYATVIFIIIGGYKYILSRGDSGKMSQAKDMISSAIVGLIISMVSIMLVNVIAGAFH